MNSITIAGQLGRNAEQRFLPNGDAVANFSIADSQGKDKLTIWWNCQLFGKRAESLAPYLVKGQALTVSGSVTKRTYTDKSGQERVSTDIRVNDIALQGQKKQTTEAVNKPSQELDQKNVFDDMDDDLPF